MTTATDKVRELLAEEPTEALADAVDALCDYHDAAVALLCKLHIDGYVRDTWPDLATALANADDRLARAVEVEEDGDG